MRSLRYKGGNTFTGNSVSQVSAKWSVQLQWGKLFPWDDLQVAEKKLKVGGLFARL